VIKGCLKHAQHLFSAADTYDWSVFDLLNVDWDASLENEKVKLHALVKRYATPKTTQRMVNADGKMENVVLPSLFVRQAEHIWMMKTS
jgi:hypothetical protein